MMTVLTREKISRIVNDYAPKIRGLKRVGLVGSYARGDYNEASDVDLVFELDGTDKTLTDTVIVLRRIFIDQFRRKLDVIKYDSIYKYLTLPLNEYRVNGYKKMLEDLIWIWEAS